MARTIALAASLILAALLAWFQELPPHARRADAPANVFAAERAMGDVAAIARRPHPVGSPANAAVRDYVLRRIAALGLTAELQRAEAVETRPAEHGETLAVGGPVENIIAVLPGRNRTAPALTLMAHYDSVPASPGAADDAAGVASALEVVRALKAQGAPARDVILVITDGEEAGLLGARAFFREHPLAKRIGFVINMEARGGGGRAQMFQTGPQNGETIALLQRSAVRPVSSSLAVFLYEHMPNDTDFSVSRAAGLPGLNYAFIGRQFDYHSPTSTPANLERGTLQDMGQQVLAAASATAFAEALPAKAPDLVYAHTIRGGVIAYPPEWGWGLLAASAALLALAIGWVRRSEAFAWPDVARGAGAAIYLLAGAATLLRLARRATGAEFGFLEQRFLAAQANLYEAALMLIGVGMALYAAAALARGKVRAPAAALPLSAGVLCSAFGLVDPVGLGLGLGAAVAAFAVFGKPAGTAGGWAGLLATGLAAATALQIAAPATAFLVAWPLLLACLAALLCRLGALRGPWATSVIVLIAIIGLAWIGGFAHNLFLGLDMPELLAATAWLAAFLIWPMAHPRIGGAGRITALLVLAAGFALIAVVRLHQPWNERFPQATIVAYQIDADTGASLRVSSAPGHSSWADDVLRADGGKITRRELPPLWRREVRVAPARPIAAPAAALALTTLDGQAALRVKAPQGARVLALDVRTTVPVSGVTLNGLPVAILDHPGRWARIRWQGDNPEVSLAFKPSGPGALEVRHAAVTEGWPAAAKPLPPRPGDVMAFDLSDSTVVSGSARLTW